MLNLKEPIGAIDFKECPGYPGSCRCEPICRCGFRKHTAVHGPLYGQLPGSMPYDHEFNPGIKMKKWVVEIVPHSGDKSDAGYLHMEADSAQDAQAIDRGANRNLNHEKYFTRITPPKSETGR